MKKAISIALVMTLALMVLPGCADSHDVPSEQVPPNSEHPTSETAKPSASPADSTAETFEYDGLSLEVSNVKEIKMGTAVLDETETWEYAIYVVYPGAIAKILNAGMFEDEESGLPSANWHFDSSEIGRIDIVDGMEPLEITGDILGVYSEGVYVLGFEMYNTSEGD